MGINDHGTLHGKTQIQLASEEGDLKKVIELMDAGADLDLRAAGENAGKTAAMFAASGGHVEVLRAMQRGPSLLNLAAEDGGTPVMSAAAHGHMDVLQLLISKDVDLNVQDEDGWTALMFATAAGLKGTVAQLLKAGVDTELKNVEGDTALALARSSKHDKGQIADLLSGKEPLANIPEHCFNGQ